MKYRILTTLLLAVLLPMLISCGHKTGKTAESAVNKGTAESAVNEGTADFTFEEPSLPAESGANRNYSMVPVSEAYELTYKYQILDELMYNTETGSKMCVYLPAADQMKNGVAPAVLYLHGGTWVEGSRIDILGSVMTAFRDAGYVFVSIDYQFVGPHHHCADMLDEIATAVEYLRKNAENLHIDPTKKLGITGHSAGAHLALMYAYTYEDSPIEIGVVCPLAPPTSFDIDKDLLYSYFNSRAELITVCEYLCGQVFVNEDISIMDNVSPINYVKPENPPTVFIYGEHDDVVLPGTSQMFLEKLADSGAVYSAFALPNSGHGLDSDPKIMDEALAKFIEFMEKYL